MRARAGEHVLDLHGGHGVMLWPRTASPSALAPRVSPFLSPAPSLATFLPLPSSSSFVPSFLPLSLSLSLSPHLLSHLSFVCSPSNQGQNGADKPLQVSLGYGRDAGESPPPPSPKVGASVCLCISVSISICTSSVSPYPPALLGFRRRLPERILSGARDLSLSLCPL